MSMTFPNPQAVNIQLSNAYRQPCPFVLVAVPFPFVSSPPQMEFEAFRSQGGIETLRCPSQELISLLQHSDCSRWTWDVSRRGTESQAKLGRYGWGDGNGCVGNWCLGQGRGFQCLRVVEINWPASAKGEKVRRFILVRSPRRRRSPGFIQLIDSLETGPEQFRNPLAGVGVWVEGPCDSTRKSGRIRNPKPGIATCSSWLLRVYTAPVLAPSMTHLNSCPNFPNRNSTSLSYSHPSFSSLRFATSPIPNLRPGPYPMSPEPQPKGRGKGQTPLQWRSGLKLIRPPFSPCKCGVVPTVAHSTLNNATTYGSSSTQQSLERAASLNGILVPSHHAAHVEQRQNPRRS